MIGRRNAELPLPVYHALSTLGRHLATGQTPHGLESVLIRLSELPAKSAFSAGHAIADAAALQWRRLEDNVTAAAPLSDLKLLDRYPDIAWLFLFHPNGYVREAALDTIGSPPTSPFFYAALACRLNDWVAPVRQAAVDCVSRVLPYAAPDLAAHVALDLLDRRITWARWGIEENSKLDALLGESPVVARLAALIANGTTGSLGKALFHALRFSSMDEYLPTLATKAIQPAVRAVALRCLLRRRASWPIGFRMQLIDKLRGDRRRAVELAHREIAAPPLGELISAGLADRSAVVRRAAADALIDALIKDRGEIADLRKIVERLATDKSPSLRERAAFMRRRFLADEPSLTTR